LPTIRIDFPANDESSRREETIETGGWRNSRHENGFLRNLDKSVNPEGFAGRLNYNSRTGDLIGCPTRRRLLLELKRNQK
jgi:hypothetical protein